MNLTITEQLMFSMLQIIQLDSEGKRAVGTATGFVLGFRTSDTYVKPMLVTNKHVFRNCSKISVNFTLCKEDGSPDVGNSVAILINADSRIEHDEVDLAILPLAPALNSIEKTGHRAFCTIISTDIILTESDWKHLDAIEPVITMGYPDSRRDIVNNLPIFRSGITATHPFYNFEGRPEFLVDIPCYKGCSGSPVLIRRKDQFFLIGVQYRMQTVKTFGSLEPKLSALSTVCPVTEIPMNLAQAIKSTKILDFIPKVFSLTANHHVISDGNI